MIFGVETDWFSWTQLAVAGRRGVEGAVWAGEEQFVQSECALEDSDDFATALVRQGVIEDQVFGEVRHFARVEVLRLRAAERARAFETGSAGEFLEGGFDTAHQAVGQAGIADVVIEVPLGDPVRRGRGRLTPSFYWASVKSFSSFFSFAKTVPKFVSIRLHARLFVRLFSVVKWFLKTCATVGSGRCSIHGVRVRGQKMKAV